MLYIGRIVVVDVCFNGGKAMINVICYYSLLSLISGFCEIGIVVWGMRAFGIAGALVGALCYQLGNLVPAPVKLSKKICWLLLSISAVFGLAGFFQPVFLYPAVIVFTMVLQNERSILKNKTKNTGSKVSKRLFRIIGFACGFAYGMDIYCISQILFFICVLLVAVCLRRNKDDVKSSFSIPHFNKLDLILIFHEIHYFVYCYSILLIVYSLNVYGEIVGMYASIAFALSWIPYALVPNLYKSPKILRKLGYKETFLIGHSILTVILVIMFFLFRAELSSGNLPLISLVIWLLTGFGGTTEFCIEEIDKNNGTYVKNNHNSAENIGHILGVSLSFIIYYVTSNLYISILVAGIFAFLALLSMTLLVKEESK